MHKEFLVGKNIYLREIEQADLNDNYQQWFNDEEVCFLNSHHRFPNYRQDMESYYNEVIKGRNNLILAIIAKDTDLHIGNVSLQNIDFLNQNAELAIILGNKNYWSKGIGKEACQLIISHGFNNLNLRRIYFGTSAENVGMQKIGEGFGFKKEGIARSAMFKNGKWQDIYNFGLLKDELQK